MQGCAENASRTSVKLIGWRSLGDSWHSGGSDDRSDVSATGFTSAVRDHFGKVHSAVFICNHVLHVDVDDAAELLLLLILLHELGHADDISKSINFNHENATIERTSAEAYAHSFVIRTCRKRGYSLALMAYLDSLGKHVKSPDDAVRISAERALAEHDLPSLNAWIASRNSTEGFRRAVIRAGRQADAGKAAAKLRDSDP